MAKLCYLGALKSAASGLYGHRASAFHSGAGAPLLEQQGAGDRRRHGQRSPPSLPASPSAILDVHHRSRGHFIPKCDIATRQTRASLAAAAVHGGLKKTQRGLAGYTISNSARIQASARQGLLRENGFPRLVGAPRWPVGASWWSVARKAAQAWPFSVAHEFERCATSGHPSASLEETHRVRAAAPFNRGKAPSSPPRCVLLRCIGFRYHFAQP